MKKAQSKRDARLYRRLEQSFVLAMLLPASACKGERPAGSGDSCCSEHEWTTSPELAKAYATKDATETLGCPSLITSAADDAGAPPSEYGPLDLKKEATQERRAKNDATCVYRVVSCCPGGRPLIEQGTAVVASRVRGSTWSRRALGRSLGERADIARAWLDDALAEHASVASFSRATLELLAVGAPPDLVAAHQRAALDEIRHAELCFALAAAYGEAFDPGPMAVPSPRSADLVRLACDTFVEGCVAETIGALLASRALEACTVAEPQDALRIIADDEAEHAALAWRTLAWAIAKGGEPVVRAVLERACVREVPFASTVDCPAHGRLGDDEVARAARDAWHFVIEPQLRTVRARCLVGS
jgi:hypothetical protein